MKTICLKILAHEGGYITGDPEEAGPCDVEWWLNIDIDETGAFLRVEGQSFLEAKELLLLDRSNAEFMGDNVKGVTVEVVDGFPKGSFGL